MKKFFLIAAIFSLFLLYSCTIDNEINYKYKIYNNLTNEEITIKSESDTIKLSDIEVKDVEGYYFRGFKTNLDEEKYLKEDTELTYSSDLQIYTVYQENPFIIDEVGRVDLSVSQTITSKLEYVDGTASISGSDYSLENAKMKIRLRGNSSLAAPKKSYKIKFDKKQNVFGFSNDKEWALIANYFDPSLMRNFYAYKLALAMEMEEYVKCKYVEVYLNGNNQGLYLLVETIKTGKERIDIEVEEDVVDLPFLLEVDYKMIETTAPDSNGVKDVDYFELNLSKLGGRTYPIGCKYPKSFDTITTEQYESIKNRVSSAYKSCMREDYRDYFDIDSVIDFFLIEELFMNIDMDYSSVYFYQPLNGKIHFGPVWDFDISSGNCNYANNYSPEVLMTDVNGSNFLFAKLLKRQSFVDLFAERLAEVRKYIMPMMMDSFIINYEFIKNYEITDNSIWNALNTYEWPKPDRLVGISYKAQVNFLKNYLDRHAVRMAELIK